MRESPALTIDIPGGAAWSAVVARGHALRLTAAGAGANVSTLVFAAADPLERLNVPDTLKSQMSACVRAPMVLMSDMGTALMSVTASSVDWHDALTGHSLDADLERFGPSSYQKDGNAWRRSARAGLLDELAVRGLGVRDLHATVNWFTKVQPEDDERATLRYVAGGIHAGDFVQLRADQDVLVVLSTSPHPLNPATDWSPAPITAEIVGVEPRGDDDPSQQFRAESARALAAADGGRA